MENVGQKMVKTPAVMFYNNFHLTHREKLSLMPKMPAGNAIIITRLSKAEDFFKKNNTYGL